jgi:signal transduction histidine kinase
VAASIKSDGESSTMSALEKVNILLVDDQLQRLLSYQTVLHDLGQNLISARSGTEALQLLMQHDIAIVLLDVSMPGLDGFETAALIHEHPRYERTPIIFVTGVHDTDMDRLRGYKLGAVDYVSIPVVPEILRSKVSVLVELQNQRRKLEVLNKSLADANSKLEAEKHRELETLNESLRLANRELACANAALQLENAERVRVEDALKNADRYKDEFIAILAHELRNPLAPIRSAMEIMSQITIEDSRLQWSRDVVQRQVVHLSRLVDDLLDISRITRGTINLSKAPVTAGIVVSRSLETVNPLIEKLQHELHVDCQDETLVIEGDVTRLVQVLSNILSNAAKYTPAGGRIDLSVRQCDGFVEFRVRDNGIGIAPDSVDRIFALFARVTETENHQHDGLGIGLALARQLVQLHDGEISVHSDGLDLGSEFLVRLPLLNAVPTRSDSASASVVIPEPPSVARLKVLIADDNNDALETLALLLEMAGHEVVKAIDGQAALEAATTHRPDIALLDIGMPMLNGCEVAKNIRATAWGGAITLVAVSGWGQQDDVQRSNEAGFNLHLVKPIDFEAVEKILAQRATGATQAAGGTSFTASAAS